MAHDVFVSYSNVDKATADAVVAHLEHDGTRCWVAPRDIVPGTSWGDAIAAAIPESRVMVLVLSAHSNRSRQVIREVERAVAADVAILPFRIDPTDPTGAMAYFLGTEHWLDALTPPMERHIERLSATVRMLVTGQAVPRGGLDAPPPIVTRRPRGRSRAVIVAGAGTAVVGAAVVLGFALGLWQPGGASPTASDAPGPGVVGSGVAPSVARSPTVGLEEVGRFSPIDLEPGDLNPPGAIIGLDVDGRWLAYANGIDGVTRMAIDDPANPQLLTTYSIGDAQAVAIAGDHLVAAGTAAGSAYISVFGINGTDAGRIELRSVDLAYGLAFRSGYAYVASHDYVGIIDLTVLPGPRLAFEWVPPGSTGNPASAFVTDGVGYFGAGWDGLYVLDLANPASPRLLGHWTSPDWVIDVVVVDGIGYLTLGDSGLATVDLRDPASPRLLGAVTLPGFAGPLDVADGLAFVGSYGADGELGGVTVVDVADPERPASIGVFGRLPSLSDLELADGHLFVSDESEGLIVYRITGIE